MRMKVKVASKYLRYENYDHVALLAKIKAADGKMVDGKVEIEMSPVQDRKKDFRNADATMREKLGQSDWKCPDGRPLLRAFVSWLLRSHRYIGLTQKTKGRERANRYGRFWILM